jgi:hypothetical protein
VELLRAILDSYAEQTSGKWTLHPQDSPATRRADLDTAKQVLTTLASRLEYSITSEERNWRILRWLEADQPAYEFHIIASAVSGKILRMTGDPSLHRVLVLPGGRAGLLAYKLERDPSLRACAESWRVLKFRQLRRIAGIKGLMREQWLKELSGDPLEPPEQLKLF